MTRSWRHFNKANAGRIRLIRLSQSSALTPNQARLKRRLERVCRLFWGKENRRALQRLLDFNARLRRLEGVVDARIEEREKQHEQ